MAGLWSRSFRILFSLFALSVLLLGQVGSVFAFSGMPASLVLGQSSFTTNTPSTTQTGLNVPEGLALDGSGNLWVVEFFNHRVVEYSPPFSSGMAAAHVLGQPGFTTGTFNKGSGFTTGACNVGDGTVNQCGLGNPAAIAFDASGNLWVADWGNRRVLEFAQGSLNTNGAPAAHVLGQPDFTTGTTNKGSGFTTIGCNVGDGTVNQCGLNDPRGLAFDSSGNLWVNEESNTRVLEFAQGSLNTNGAPAAHVLGQPDFTTATVNKGSGFATAGCNVGDGNVNQCGLRYPEGQSAFDSSGNFWVSDGGNSRVLEFMPPFSNGMPASLVLGQSSFTTRTFATTQNGLGGPGGVMFDSSGNLWVSDMSNNRVLEFTRPFSNGMLASLVLGQPDFTHNTANNNVGFLSDCTSTVNACGMNSPAGLASGSLWVVDEDNSRVLQFTSTSTPPPVIPEYPLGLPLLAVFMIFAYGLVKRRTMNPS